MHEAGRGRGSGRTDVVGAQGRDERSHHCSDQETPELTRRFIPCPCSTGPLSPLHKMSQLRYCFLGVYCIQSLFSLKLQPSGALIEAPPAPAVPVRHRAPPAQGLSEGPPRDRLYSLRDGVLGGLDFAEKLLRYAVVEGELAIEHGEEHHTQRPHVTGFSTVRPSCREQGDKSNRRHNTAPLCSPPPAVKALKQPLHVNLFSKY